MNKPENPIKIKRKDLEELETKLTRTRPELYKNKKGGQKTLMTPDLLDIVRRIVREGGHIDAIAKATEMNSKTIEHWYYTNYEGFKDKCKIWKYAGLIEKAENISHEILDLPTDILELDNNGDTMRQVKNIEVVKVKQKESQYIRSTLAKEDYGTTEEKGREGNITINVLNFGDKPTKQGKVIDHE